MGGIYREHIVLNQPDSTDSEEHQIARWKERKMIEQWQRANRQGDCIVVGDTNLDIFKWANSNQINVIMTDLVKNELETEGAQQLVVGATRFWPNQRDYLINQCWTNCPQKIIYVNNVTNGTSNHNIIEVNINLKGNIGAPTEIWRRKLKNLDTECYRRKVDNIDLD